MAHVHKVAVFPFIPLAVLLLYSPLIAAMLHFPFLSIPLAACPVSFLPSPVGFQTQIWTAALDFIALKCISRKILPFRERVIFRKKR